MRIHGLAERVGIPARERERRRGRKHDAIAHHLHVHRVGARPDRVAGRAARAEHAQRAGGEPALEAECLLQPALQPLRRRPAPAAARRQQLERGEARARSEQAGDDELAVHPLTLLEALEKQTRRVYRGHRGDSSGA